MKKLIIILLFCPLISIAQKTDSINIQNRYILIEKNNPLFSMDISKDSLSSSFSILRYEFRTKKLQQEYEKKRKEKFEIKKNYYITFISGTKPKTICLNSDDIVYSIEDISKEKIYLEDKAIFIQKINCKQYVAFITHPIEEL